MKLSTSSIPVQTKTRKMKTSSSSYRGIFLEDIVLVECEGKYTLEMAQDLRAIHGIDIEAEMLKILQFEMGL